EENSHEQPPTSLMHPSLAAGARASRRTGRRLGAVQTHEFRDGQSRHGPTFSLGRYGPALPRDARLQQRGDVPPSYSRDDARHAAHDRRWWGDPGHGVRALWYGLLWHAGLWHAGLWHAGLWHAGLWHAGLWHNEYEYRSP